jgi:hypothetical protein
MKQEKIPDTLRLVRGDKLLGTVALKPIEPGSPWRSGAFSPTLAFQSAKSLFDHELQLLRANTNDDPAQWDEWEAAHEELHEPGLRLESEDRSFVADEILVHIEGGELWWRGDDETDD